MKRLRPTTVFMLLYPLCMVLSGEIPPDTPENHSSVPADTTGEQQIPSPDKPSTAVSSPADDTVFIPDTLAGTGQDAQTILYDSLLPLRAGDSTFFTEDTTSKVSVARALLRDTLIAMKERSSNIYRRFPETIDSIVPALQVYPHQIFGSDAVGISEALRFSPFFVTIPYTISNSLNRFLFMGYPFSPTYLLSHDFFSHQPEYELGGTDYLYTTMVEKIRVVPGERLDFTPRPAGLAVPEALLFWENGVFDETVLRVLFARPLSRRLDVAVFSNFRSFDGKDYSQPPGNVFYSLSRSIIDDTSRISIRGYTPYIREHTAGIRASLHDGNGLNGTLHYEYLDLTGERSSDDGADNLRWDRYNRYCHHVDGRLYAIKLGPLLIDGQWALVKNSVIRTPPINHASGKDRGTLLATGGAFNAALPVFTRDTLEVGYAPSIRQKVLYDGSEIDIRDHRISVAYIRPFSAGRLDGAITAGLGQDMHSIQDAFSRVTVWNAGIRAGMSGQKLSLYGRRCAVPYEFPFDTAHIVSGTMFDTYQSYGADLYLNSPRIALLAGYGYIIGVDSSSLAHTWPGSVAPYSQPRSVLTLAPMVGRFFGFSLYGRWMYSDSRPRHKAQAAVSYETLVIDGKECIRVDLGLDYWSERDPIVYGGIDTWNREILDLFLKMSVQVRTFRLFYKIDNILNRRIAYVPGYTMPGAVYRWGFNWQLQR